MALMRSASMILAFLSELNRTFDYTPVAIAGSRRGLPPFAALPYHRALEAEQST
jgi:hypothetical protein